MLNFYSLYLCLPHCLSSFSPTVCLSVCLSLSVLLSPSYSLYTTRHCLRQTSTLWTRFNNKNRPDTFVLTLLELTLLRNDFQFNNETYLQTKGTAMGKKYAPAFANIFMHYWNNKRHVKRSEESTLEERCYPWNCQARGVEEDQREGSWMQSERIWRW